MNKITIIGRLTKDPELANTTNGTTMSRFNVACKGTSKSANGDPAVDFFSCIAWRTTAENLAKYSKKGDLIAIYGTMNSRKYENEKGNVQTLWECNVETFEFLSTRTDKETNKASSTDDLKEIDEDDDNLPF